MLKIIIGSFVLASSIFAVDLQNDGVEIKIKNSNDEAKTLIIKREKPQECLGVNFDPKNGKTTFYVTEEA